MKVYKIVKRISNNMLISSNTKKNTSRFDGETILHYPEGIRVYPKIGKLFAFSDVFYAQSFISNSSSDDQNEIWLADAGKVTTMKRICYYGGVFEEYKQFWKAMKENKDYDGTTLTIHPGTIFCSSIKLISRVNI